MSETVTPTTYYLAICDECRQVHSFTSERERDLWQTQHPHWDDA